MKDFIKMVLIPSLLIFIFAGATIFVLDFFSLVTQETGTYIGLIIGCIWSAIVSVMLSD